MESLQKLKSNISSCIYRLKYHFIKKRITVNSIASIEETIEKIINDKVSVSRFGDGEFRWILKNEHKSFEEVSDLLSERLAEVLASNVDGHIVCVQAALGGLSHANKETKQYWKTFLGIYGLKLSKIYDIKKHYYNANISRFYISSADRKLAQKRFELLKKIWENRNIVIVEGEYSRLGVGNDLFDNVLSIRRIVGPSKNAFRKYDLIIASVERNYHKDDLVILALGPTATIMAYDLACNGKQAIDIGHIDVEYEWFIRKCTSREAIPGKAVNEIESDKSQEKLSEEVYKEYSQQIVEHIT